MDLGLWAGGISVGLATAELANVEIEALIRKADADMYDRRGVRRAASEG